MNDFVVIGLLAVVGFVGLMGLAIAGENYKCSSRAELMQLEKSYGPLQGCMVKVRGKWLPLSAIREVDI